MPKDFLVFDPTVVSGYKEEVTATGTAINRLKGMFSNLGDSFTSATANLLNGLTETNNIIATKSAEIEKLTAGPDVDGSIKNAVARFSAGNNLINGDQLEQVKLAKEQELGALANLIHGDKNVEGSVESKIHKLMGDGDIEASLDTIKEISDFVKKGGVVDTAIIAYLEQFKNQIKGDASDSADTLGELEVQVNEILNLASKMSSDIDKATAKVITPDNVINKVRDNNIVGAATVIDMIRKMGMAKPVHFEIVNEGMINLPDQEFSISSIPSGRAFIKETVDGDELVVNVKWVDENEFMVVNSDGEMVGDIYDGWIGVASAYNYDDASSLDATKFIDALPPRVAENVRSILTTQSSWGGYRWSYDAKDWLNPVGDRIFGEPGESFADANGYTLPKYQEFYGCNKYGLFELNGKMYNNEGKEYVVSEDDNEGAVVINLVADAAKPNGMALDARFKYIPGIYPSTFVDGFEFTPEDDVGINGLNSHGHFLDTDSGESYTRNGDLVQYHDDGSYEVYYDEDGNTTKIYPNFNYAEYAPGKTIYQPKYN